MVPDEGLLRVPEAPPVGIGPADYLVQTWEPDDGLPESTVTAMVQAEDGYLWLGTFKGLVRFDGLTFEVLDSAREPGLPGSGVVNLHLETSGRLWVSTESGLASRFRGEWTRYGPESGWKGNYVRTFTERDGLLCLTSFDGQVAVVRDGRIEGLPEPQGLRGEGYFGHLDGQGRVWALQAGYLGSWDGTAWRTSAVLPLKAGESGAAITGRDGTLVVASPGRLDRYEGDRFISGIALRQPLPPVWRLDEDREGTVWVAGMSEGLVAIRRNGEVRRYGTANGLPSDAIRFTFEDREGSRWVGTSGGGLARFTARRFRMFGVAKGLPERNVKAVVAESRGSIVAATFGRGLVRIEGGRVQSLAGTADLSGPNYGYCLLEDRAGTLWYGTFGDGLYRLRGDRLEAVPRERSAGKSITALAEDPRGRVWVGGDLGVALWEGGQATVSHARPDLKLGRMRAFAATETGGMWAGGGDGLFRWEQGEWREVKGPGNRALSGVLCLRADTDGALWVGEEGFGLLRHHASGWTSVARSQGLGASAIGAILEDSSGFWWLPSNQGVLRLEPARLREVAAGIRTRLDGTQFDRSDGLATVECATGLGSTATRDREGRLWFATAKGVAMIDPGHLVLNSTPAPVRIESIGYRDSSGEVRELPWEGRSRIEVPAGARGLRFRWTALSFAAPEKVRFAYRLGGESSPWVDAGSRRILDLYLTGPATLRFEVKAANNDGLWSDRSVALTAVVAPFLWQTVWFRGLGAVGVLALGSTGVGWLVNRRQRRRIEGLVHQAQLENERRLGDERFRSAMQHSPIGMAVVAPDGRWLEVNPAACALLGHPAPELLRAGFALVSFPEESGGILDRLRDLLERRLEVLEEERRFRHRDGHEVWALVSVSAVWNPDGTPWHLVMQLQDVTEERAAERRRRELEGQLRQKQKLEAVGILAGGIAHDFNNILAAIVSFAELAKMENPDRPELGDQLDQILKSSGRAADLVRQILSFSRRQDRDRLLLPPGPVVQEALHLLRSTLPATVDLQCRVDAGLPEVLLDPTQIHQLLMNLCTNAAHAMGGRPGRIDVALSQVTVAPGSPEVREDLPPGEYLRLGVSDTGVGMDDALMQHIFEPFFTTKGPGEGTGLGLAVVHGIVQAHRGAIAVRSQPGAGTTFVIHLPVVRSGAAPDAEPAGPVPRGRGERILLVDDEVGLSQGIAGLLRMLGYQPAVFNRPAEALEAFEREPQGYALVITDLTMPGMNGLDLARQLHALHPDQPVLLMSGLGSNVTPEALQAVGIRERLNKPVGYHALAEAVDRALRENPVPAWVAA